MAAIHHATQARARKHGCSIVELGDGGFALDHDNSRRRSIDSWDSAKEAAEAANGYSTWQPLSSFLCGVMAKSYHDRYESNPHGPGCGDGLDVAMRDHCTQDGEDLDLDLLREIGNDAGVWKEEWARLNPGMQRMNLANRLRALLRNGKDAEITIGEVTGRFGVAFRPAKRSAKR